MSEMADALVLMSVEDDGVAFLPYIFCVLKSPYDFIAKKLFLSWHWALEDLYIINIETYKSCLICVGSQKLFLDNNS